MEKKELLELQEKMYHYEVTKWNIPFRAVKHTVITVCDMLNPIFSALDSYRYMRLFFNEVDFDAIVERSEPVIILSNLNKIYTVLNVALLNDVNRVLNEFEDNMPKRAKPDLLDSQIRILALIGKLKAQMPKEGAQTFGARFQTISKHIETNQPNLLMPIEYQIFVGSFEDDLIKHLVNRLSIISETVENILRTKNEIIEAKKETLPPQPIETNLTQSTNFDFTNNFDHVKPSNVYNHFQKLVTWKALTEQELRCYLIDAFQDCKPTKQKKTLKGTKKRKEIQGLFYDFYNEIAGKPHNEKLKYVDLLGEHFENYNSASIMTNFSKSKY